MKIYKIAPLLCLIFIISCKAKKEAITPGNGSYQMTIKKSSNSSSDPVVYGYIFEERSTKPVVAPRITVNDKDSYKTDVNNGKYAFKIKPGTYKFKGQGIGYYWLLTKNITLSAGDSVKIVFSLKPDKTPLH